MIVFVYKAVKEDTPLLSLNWVIQYRPSEAWLDNSGAGSTQPSNLCLSFPLWRTQDSAAGFLNSAIFCMKCYLKGWLSAKLAHFFFHICYYAWLWPSLTSLCLLLQTISGRSSAIDQSKIRAEYTVCVSWVSYRKTGHLIWFGLPVIMSCLHISLNVHWENVPLMPRRSPFR